MSGIRSTSHLGRVAVGVPRITPRPASPNTSIARSGLHYIDVMLITLITAILVALTFNRLVLGGRAEFVGWKGMIPSDHGG